MCAASTGLGPAWQPRSFALLAKRYTPDGQVMTDVTYDRVGNGRVMRMMPSPLDVAFAALKNDQAAALLSDELASYPYATELACSRELVDSLGPTFFESSLYTAWLGHCASSRRRRTCRSSPDRSAGRGQHRSLGPGSWARSLRPGPSFATTRCSIPRPAKARSSRASFRRATSIPIPSSSRRFRALPRWDRTA